MGIHDTIIKLEELRKKVQIDQVMTVCPMFIMLFLSIFVPQLSFLMAIVSMGMILYGIKHQKEDKKKFKSLYKQTFVTQLLSERFENVYYSWESGFTQDAVKLFNLVQLGNRFYSEDYLSAFYNGIHFEQSDVTVQYHTSGKNSHTTTYFKGRMFAFDFPHKNVASVRCFSNTFFYKAGSNNQKIKLESGNFNRIFKTDAFYEHDAFYFLTPQMMERISALNAKYGNVAVHFMGNKLFIGINMKSDAFDHDYSKKVDYLEEVAKMNQDTQVIIDIINTLSYMQNY